MLKLFGKKKLILSFEYGIVIADVLKQKGVELTPEIVNRMEDIIVKEFNSKSSSKVACEMIPNILAAIETN